MFGLKTRLGSLLKFRQDSQRVFVFSALAIGLVSGLSALFLEFGAYWLGALRVQASSVYPAWIVLPAFGLTGGLISGFLVQKFSPTAYGSGIPQVRASLLGARITLDFKLAMVKLLAGSIALGSGLFLGREGPTVHMGAALAAHLNKFFPLSKDKRKQLMAAGAGAGLAAAFNAPIAGVLFVAEELLKDVSTSTIGTAILSCFVASALTHVLNAPHMESTLQIQALELSYTWQDIFFWVLLGVLAGWLGTVFNRGVIFFLKLNRDYLKIPVALKVGFAGLISGIVIAMMPEDAHFRDYAALRDLIVAGHEHWYMVPFAFGSFYLLTLLAYGSGAPGGLFAPAIVLGSALGAMVAYLEYYLFKVGSVETMAMVGMGAFFAAVARVPITAVVIVSEITKHYNLVPPLMVATATACFIGSKIEEGSVYDMLRQYSGLDEEAAKGREQEHSESASDLMRPVKVSLSTESSAAELLQAIGDSNHCCLPVLDGNRFLGFLDPGKVVEHCQLSFKEADWLASSLQSELPQLAPELSLHEAMNIFREASQQVLAVTKEGELLGLLYRADLEAKLLQSNGSAPAKL